LWARALAQRVPVEINPLPAKARTHMYSISAIFESDTGNWEDFAPLKCYYF